MGHSTGERPGSNDYVVLDLPENSCSVLLNLDLVEALKRFGKQGRKGIHGILLGRAVQSGSNRILLTVEDCQAVQDPQRIPEDLAYWRTDEPERINAVGLLSDGSNDDWASFDRHFAGSAAVFLIIVPVRGPVPMGRVLWSGSAPLESDTLYSEIPLDSSQLKRGGFTILRGTRPTEPRRRLGLARPSRRWAWTPLAPALLAILLVIGWAMYPRSSSAPAVASDQAPIEVAAPTRVQEQEAAPIATPAPPPPSRTDRRRRPAPSTVGVEFHAAAPSAARGIFNRVPGLPLFRRLRSKDVADFVPAAPATSAKVAVPPQTAHEFPGEWRVDLRLTIDKSGQVTQASLLSANANREFVKLARNAIDNWEFEPARLHQRPVSSTLDITFRFRNPLPEPGERAGR